jgi:hypothetical protein
VSLQLLGSFCFSRLRVDPLFRPSIDKREVLVGVKGWPPPVTEPLRGSRSSDSE